MESNKAMRAQVNWSAQLVYFKLNCVLKLFAKPLKVEKLEKLQKLQDW